MEMTSLLPGHVASAWVVPGSPPGSSPSLPWGLCLSRADQVHRHLDQHEVRYLQFAFRWMNNLLMREVPLRCTIRLWDTYQVSCPRRPPAAPRTLPPAALALCPQASARGTSYSGVLVI